MCVCVCMGWGGVGLLIIEDVSTWGRGRIRQIENSMSSILHFQKRFLRSITPPSYPIELIHNPNIPLTQTTKEISQKKKIIIRTTCNIEIISE